jgi:hypothetical protein
LDVSSTKESAFLSSNKSPQGSAKDIVIGAKAVSAVSIHTMIDSQIAGDAPLPLAKKLQCSTISSLTMTYFKESNEKLNHFQLH